MQAGQLEIKEFDVQLVDDCSFFITFKVYGSDPVNGKKPTTFNDIRQAAIEYWGLNQFQKYFIITDEYLNNLSVYKDSVQNFFSTKNIEEAYKPLNSKSEACVFFLCKNN